MPQGPSFALKVVACGPGRTGEAVVAMMELELRQLDCKYAALRIAAPLGPLLASLAAIGQQVPVLVAGGAANGDGAVLVDGFRRKTALVQLKRDTVRATRLDIDESEALVLRHKLGAANRPSALEDGWLLVELLEHHDLTQRELGLRLQRSASWVNGRLGLVRELPKTIQDLVRHGEVPAHCAARDLLAFARANKGACQRLGANLAGQRYSSREIEALCAHWKQATPAQRDHIEATPALFCKVLAEPGLPEHDKQVAEMLHGLLKMTQIAGRLWPVGYRRRANGAEFARVRTVAGARDRFEHAWDGLRKVLHEEERAKVLHEEEKVDA